MKKINIITIMIFMLAFGACDSFLDVTPSNSGDASQSIQTVEDAQVMMNGVMRKMSSYAYYGRNFILYGDTKGGDFAIRSQGRGYDGLYTFNHSATSGSYSTYWSQMYHCITQVNNILENIERLENQGSEEDFSQIKGEALTARANIYFDLVRLYGKPYDMDAQSYGVPYVTEVLEAASTPARSTVAENYDGILKDLTTAAPLMEKEGNDGYFSYYSNMALQARVNLYMENYSQALTAAEEIINSGEYTLYENDEWYESWSEEFGDESIFEIAMYVDEADLGTSSLGFYLMRLGKMKNAMGWFMASDYFLNRLGEDSNDVRWSVMEADETSDTRLGSCVKYSLGDKEGSITAVNIKVIRLSEIYLIAAEAALLGSSTDKVKAAEYLNAIRKRSPSLAPVTAADISLDMILDERSKELFAEGHRFFDMMRCNKSITFNDDFITPSVLITHREQTIDRTFYKAILPIGIEELDANPAISNQQNSGY